MTQPPWTLKGGEPVMTDFAEEQYQQWCSLHHLDPEDVGSMTAYEEEFDADQLWLDEQYRQQLMEGWRHTDSGF